MTTSLLVFLDIDVVVPAAVVPAVIAVLKEFRSVFIILVAVQEEEEEEEDEDDP